MVQREAESALAGSALIPESAVRFRRIRPRPLKLVRVRLRSRRSARRHPQWEADSERAAPTARPDRPKRRARR